MILQRITGRSACLAALGLALAGTAMPSRSLGQAPAAAEAPPPAPNPVPPPVPAPSVINPLAPAPAPALAPAPVPTTAPGTAVTVVENPNIQVLPPDVQVVRFHAPDGVRLEVVGPAPEPVAQGDGHGLATLGLKVGVPYRLKLSNFAGGRQHAELFPVIELVGHLHRPAGIDPARYPIRVSFGEADIVDAIDKGRLVTQVIYLEDPEHALPITLPKDEIPVVSVSAAEEPLRVAAALGRVMAIVRIGGRKPTVHELNGTEPDGLGLAGMPAPSPCPFVGSDGAGCRLPCGPVCGKRPEPGRIWIPRDEYLCDGGDRAEPAHFGGDGGLRGIDPRDAVIEFDDGRRPRILPTNMVCIYAPRFAEIRNSVGPNETSVVEITGRAHSLAHEVQLDARAFARKMVQNQGAEANLHRLRASGLKGNVFAGEKSELRVLSGYDNADHISGHVLVQGPEKVADRKKPGTLRDRTRFEGIKTAEGPVLTGIVEGAGEKVMAWKPRETVGVETPPNRPGLAVIKRVSASEAEAGDVLTYVIQYRNMGNTPIRSVTVTDSLLPRLGYVPGSALGPKGTVFTSGENRVGSTELRWELPGTIAPGAEGYVQFKAVVR